MAFLACWSQAPVLVPDAATRPGSVLRGHDGDDHDVSRRLFDFRAAPCPRARRSQFAIKARKLHRCQTASKSARERGIRGLVWPLQQRCKCGTSGGTRRIPHKILHFGRRRTAKTRARRRGGDGGGIAEAPARRRASGFCKKKRLPRARRRSTVERRPSRLVPASAAASCDA